MLVVLLVAVLELQAGGATPYPYPRSTVPTGQAGPIFVVSQLGLPKDYQVTLGTLAGVLARYSPRIYSIKSGSPKLLPTSVDDDTTVFWLHDLAQHHNIAFNYSYLNDLESLIALPAIKANISGFVQYDPSTRYASSTNKRLPSSHICRSRTLPSVP